jgi:hypothetical protein
VIFLVSTWYAKSKISCHSTSAKQLQRALRNVYSCQVMLQKMHEERDAPTFGEHSSSVATYDEVERVATRLIADQLYKRQANRPGDDTERKDLQMAGIEERGKTERITKYIESWSINKDFWTMIGRNTMKK